MIVIRSIWARPGIRFLVCGGFAALVNWAVRFPLSVLMPFPLAVLLSLVVGMCVGFVLYRSVVWARSHEPLARQIRLFLAVNSVNAVGILVFSTALAAALHYTSLNREWIEALAHAAGIAAGAVANYIGHSRFTFGKTRSLKPYG